MTAAELSGLTAGQRELLAAVRAAALDRRAAHAHYLEALRDAINAGVPIAGELAQSPDPLRLDPLGLGS